MKTTTIRRLTAAALACAALSIGATAADTSAAARVQVMSGRIVDAKSLAPVAGLQVVIRSVPSGRVWTATTDNRGYFSASGLLLDEFEVYVRPSLTYCGGYVWDDWGDVFPALDARLSNVDWNSWSAENLGTIGAYVRIAGRAC
ncbi:MAG TPA: carboxypeptidase-like regulatory domain-containing protein [Ilumatobacteraceae bacterium]|nr:carboxypeptidase-like regulatory domain-containing protein [Ilumatobacteraceae bacterium]